MNETQQFADVALAAHVIAGFQVIPPAGAECRAMACAYKVLGGNLDVHHVGVAHLFPFVFKKPSRAVPGA